MVLSLMRRDQWSAKKIRFWTDHIYFVVWSGCALNLRLCPINMSSIWCVEESGINLGVNYQDPDLW